MLSPLPILADLPSQDVGPQPTALSRVGILPLAPPTCRSSAQALAVFGDGCLERSGS